ncbi:MAG: hypothetical protein L0387_43010 [Acidobacteria bacterium]|nr:hypothetical protein [Acidobacteriota bacterium]
MIDRPFFTIRHIIRQSFDVNRSASRQENQQTLWIGCEIMLEASTTDRPPQRSCHFLASCFRRMALDRRQAEQAYNENRSKSSRYLLSGQPLPKTILLHNRQLADSISENAPDRAGAVGRRLRRATSKALRLKSS